MTRLVDDLGKFKCLDCENIFYMDTNVITYHLYCPYCKSDNLKEKDVEDRRVYVVMSEHNEVECVFEDRLMAESYVEKLENMAENSTWSVVKTYCY